MKKVRQHVLNILQCVRHVTKQLIKNISFFTIIRMVDPNSKDEESKAHQLGSTRLSYGNPKGESRNS